MDTLGKIWILEKTLSRGLQQISKCQTIFRTNIIIFCRQWIKVHLKKTCMALCSLLGLNSSRITRRDPTLYLSVIRKINLSFSHCLNSSRSSSSNLRSLREVTSPPTEDLPPRSCSTRVLLAMEISHPPLASSPPCKSLPGKEGRQLKPSQVSKWRISSKSQPQTRRKSISVRLI